MANRLLAELKWSRVQRSIFIGLILGCLSLAILDVILFMWIFSLLLLALYSVIVLCKVLAALCGLISRFTILVSEQDYLSVDDESLPIYTILLPLYKESRVVEKLIDHIGCLDYPKDKLDVKLLIELDDQETLGEIQRFGLPNWCELIMIPDQGPRTKPRACNVGLERARGEYLVIFDAEDRPEPDQLKKVICAYAQLSAKVVCLQAKLNFYNAKECLLARCFALEYTTWFDLYLPGLHALRAPIPLGGTSNHFKVAALKTLQGWDPYNVTEDCDLGIRIAEEGLETRIIDSVTWEEAPVKVKDWLGQRSRWIKGYFQTFWVHSRSPLFALRRLGVWGFMQMLVTVGGQVATVFLNPICWIILGAWLYFRWPIIYEHSPYTLVFFAVSLALFQFNILFIGIHLIGALRRRSYALVPAVLLLPIYWGLVSLGGWRGIFEFFWSPYKWVKTSHGLSQMFHAEAASGIREISTEESGVKSSAYIRPSFKHGVKENIGVGLVIVLFFLLITGFSMFAPAHFGYLDKVMQAQINLQEGFVETEQMIAFDDSSWLSYSELVLSLRFELGQAQPEVLALKKRDLRLMFYLKVRDGEWFNQVVDDFEIVNNTDSKILANVALDGNWQSPFPDQVWSRDYLRRVRSIGVKVFYADRDFSTVQITQIEKRAKTPDSNAVSIENLSFKSEAGQYELFEVKWQLSKAYANPFDSDVVACDVLFKRADGFSMQVPAFFTQDYHQYKSANGELLQPNGLPYWCARFAPPDAGVYTWQIAGKDIDGCVFSTEPNMLGVGKKEQRGYLQIGDNPRYFAFENGEFFYPLAINIRSPRDERNHDYFTFDFPAKEDGTYVMYSFIDEMAKAQINVGRVWMSPWFGGIEWNADEEGYHGIGVYNLQNAYRLDKIFKYAQHKNMMIELALNHHGPFTQQYDSQWQDNPYNALLGGPAKTPLDILTNPASKDLFKKRLRYISARYGAYTNLFAYVLWIEANVVDPRPQVLTAWHNEFGPFMKAIDANRHIVSTEFNNDGYDQIWKQEHIEYTQIAAYNFGSGTINVMIESAKAMQPYAKPGILEEYMGLPEGGSMDVLAHEFHDGLWAGWMLPVGGAPMPWWWNYIFEKKLHRLYPVFNAFIDKENLSLYEWEYDYHLKINGAHELRGLGRISSKQAFFWVFKDKVSNVTFGGPYRQRRKTFSESYRRQVPASFDPITAIGNIDDTGFMDIAESQLIIPLSILQPGAYRVEFWNTWAAKPVEAVDVVIDEFPFNLTLPHLTKDIAIKLKKIE